VKFAIHRLVDVFLWQLFPDGLPSDFQLINRLGLQLELMVLSHRVGFLPWQKLFFARTVEKPVKTAVKNSQNCGVRISFHNVSIS